MALPADAALRYHWRAESQGWSAGRVDSFAGPWSSAGAQIRLSGRVFTPPLCRSGISPVTLFFDNG
jgi:hypothetical protein